MTREKAREHCGVVLSRRLHDGYNMAKSLQHRGREACGLFAFGRTITVVKWVGTIRMFDLVDLYRIFKGEKIHWWGFHVRYATRGRKEEREILHDAHPHVIGGRVIDNGNHIIIKDCDMAIIHNGQVEVENFQQMIDAAKLKTGCDSEALLHFYKERGGRSILRTIPGAYVLAIADRFTQSVIMIKDRYAVRPGVIGIKDGEYCVASENVAFLENGAHVLKELEPGSIYHFLPDGSYNEEKVVEPIKKSCMFEWNYFAHLESTIDGILVRRVREILGKALAEQYVPPDADFVSYLPRCPETAAMSYFDFCKKTGKKLEYLEAFYKMRGERSFIGSTPDERGNSISTNLFLNETCRRKIYGKIGAIIDDSLIRGNNSNHAIKLLAQAGVKKVYFMSYTPPVGIRTEEYGLHGCVHGVDMPIEPIFGDEYLARDRSEEEISRLMSIKAGIEVKAIYLTLANMLGAYENIGVKSENLCYFCVGGANI